MLNFSSVRFSSVFVCRTESRVVGSLSSQIFPEWRLCVHYYISLSLSLCVISIRFSWLAGWLCTIRIEYLIGVSHHAHSTASTLAQLLTIDRPLFFLCISTFTFLFCFRELLCLFISFRCATSESYAPTLKCHADC